MTIFVALSHLRFGPLRFVELFQWPVVLALELVMAFIGSVPLVTNSNDKTNGKERKKRQLICNPP